MVKEQLHIVNGTSAITTLMNNGISGEFMEWRDVLHDGPLGPSKSRSEFLQLRAKFIGDVGWEKTDIAIKKLKARDDKLLSWQDEIIVWNSFEMFDQLQLMDILNCSPRKDISFVFVECYLSRIENAHAFLDKKHHNHEKSFDLISQIWTAIRQQDKDALQRFLKKDLSDWPFLKAGLERYILELPDEMGLNQTDRIILENLVSGPMKFGELFQRVQALEPISFMGDLSFWLRLKGLAENHSHKISIENYGDMNSKIELFSS